MIFIYIYINIYYHPWKDRVQQLTAQPWKSPKKVHLTSLSSPTIRISLCCEQSMWERLRLCHSYAFHGHGNQDEKYSSLCDSSSHRRAVRPPISTIPINSSNMCTRILQKYFLINISIERIRYPETIPINSKRLYCNPIHVWKYI